MFTQKFKEQVIYLKRKLIKDNLIIRWNIEVFSRVPGTQDLLKGWYSKYVFIRTHQKPDTSYFSPIIAVDVSTKTESLGVSSERCVRDKKLTKPFNLGDSKW